MKKRLIIITLLAIIILIQFITIDKVNPPVIADKDYLNINKAPVEVVSLFKNTCYDCHSNQTKYPWYSNIAPVSWMVKHHINEGREHINFSNFGDYSLDDKLSIQKHCIKEIKENEMPLKSYTLIHTNARLTNDSKQILIDFLNRSIQNDENEKRNQTVE